MKQKTNYFLVILVIAIFAVISFTTNIMGPILPNIKKDLGLSATEESLMSAFFFIAYLFSIPMAMVAEKIGQKKVIMLSFFVASVGCLLIGGFATKIILMGCLFAVGLGIATLQVVINPLLRAAGGVGNFAFFSIVAQIVFGLAAYMAPPVQRLIGNNIDSLQNSFLGVFIHSEYRWTPSYTVIALVFVLIALFIGFIRLPSVQLAADEQTASKNTYRDLLLSPKVWVFFFAIFCYVGVEQGITLKLKEFLMTNHSYDEVQAEGCISDFWGMLSAGCLLGLVLVKLMKEKLLLSFASIFAIIGLLVGLFGSKDLSYYGFVSVGLFLSVMWSINMSLGMSSVKAHQGALAGILCSGIIGGSLFPLLIGGVIDLTGGDYLVGMACNLFPLAYILFISFYAKPLVTNRIVKLSGLFDKQ